jgi:hypothetical protein
MCCCRVGRLDASLAVPFLVTMVAHCTPWWIWWLGYLLLGSRSLGWHSMIGGASATKGSDCGPFRWCSPQARNRLGKELELIEIMAQPVKTARKLHFPRNKLELDWIQNVKLQGMAAVDLNCPLNPKLFRLDSGWQLWHWIWTWKLKDGPTGKIELICSVTGIRISFINLHLSLEEFQVWRIDRLQSLRLRDYPSCSWSWLCWWLTPLDMDLKDGPTGKIQRNWNQNLVYKPPPITELILPNLKQGW